MSDDVATLILQDALELVADPADWYGDGRQREGEQHCPATALTVAGWARTDEWAGPAFQAAVTRWVEALRAEYGPGWGWSIKGSPEGGTTQWNDTHTHDDVVRVFTAAIEAESRFSDPA